MHWPKERQILGNVAPEAFATGLSTEKIRYDACLSLPLG